MTSYNIIIISPDPWEHVTWRRRHHVAWNLSKNHKVLFVEPPYTVMQPIRERGLNWRHLLRLGRLKYQGRNLYSYSPIRLLPLSLPGSVLFNYYEKDKQRTFNSLKIIIRKLKFQDPILWENFCVEQYDYYHLFDYKLIVADWYDNFTALVSENMGDWARSKDYCNRIEEKCNQLLKHSDIIFTVTKELYDELSKIRDCVYFVPHGVDYEIYENEKQLPNKLNRFIRGRSHPIIGFMGTIHAKLDFNLLIYLKINHPEWTMLFVGKDDFNNPIDKEMFHKLKEMQSVYHINAVDRELIPGILKYMDVCMLPLKKNAFNYGTSGTLKLREYLAAGKPVVAVNQGTSFEREEFGVAATGKKGFEKAIEYFIKEGNNPQKEAIRKKIAREGSWENRVSDMVNIIERELQ